MTLLLLFKNLSHLMIGLTLCYTFDPGHESSSFTSMLTDVPSNGPVPNLLLSLRRSLHRLRHAAEIDAVDIHRVRRGRQHILLPSGRDIFFENIDEHIGVFHVGLAVRGEVRHLRGGEI